jgi:hypothetical protein
MNSENIGTIGKGVVGTLLVSGTEIVSSATMPTPDEISTIGQLIIQLAIGIATIWKIIKKPKNNAN